MKLKLQNSNLFAIVDDALFAQLNKFTWYINCNGYAYRFNNGPQMILMHRQIMHAYNKKIIIDHIDGNPLNNQLNNLRKCSIKKKLL